MKRPYSTKLIQDLEKIFEQHDSNIDILQNLAAELQYRKTNRSKILFEKVKKRSEVVEKWRPYVNEFEGKEGRKIQDLIPEVESWDANQKVVIELQEESSVLVEAGPGAGKTAVACARVAWLIEKCDLEPSKILLISFTQAAVKELRNRIEQFAEDPINIAGLSILTLDSFTWQVVRGFDEKDTSALLQGYEKNIERFVKLLQSGNKDLKEYLEELEHVVIDESQDMVGVRGALVISLINNLREECGVTVFADSAQAIYGFTDDAENGKDGSLRTAVERIYENEVEGFQNYHLSNVHRTKDPKLLELYKIGRDRLLHLRRSSIQDWKELKNMLKGFSHGEVGHINDQSIKNKDDILVLYRTRAEVLMSSSCLWRKGIDHKIRMSGVPMRIHPWIGRLLCTYTEDSIDRNGFDELWREKVARSNCRVSFNREEAWQILQENVGVRNARIDLSRLRDLLGRRRPPVDFLVDEKSLDGPVIGTIHASKGREARQVHLMLPPDSFIEQHKDAQAIAEEERVLYVGATRAKEKLLTGAGMRLYAFRIDNSSRTCREIYKEKGCFQVEIGREGDIDNTSVVDRRMAFPEINQLQDWLWNNANSSLGMTAKYCNRTKQIHLHLDNSDYRYICALSNDFSRDIWKLKYKAVPKMGTERLKPYSPIRHIKMIGASTAVIKPEERKKLDSPYCYSGFVLVPVITAFTNIYFKKI